ncbi:PAS domain S-box protein [Hymenobacter sp. CRA2]|uniref:PAS domain S-box protein n=1 Tax=Hymenobacter sp. CRA2 TaxID=1955620 RepID=UPI00098F9DB8|nr:PAS domain S-box protein [Hymenobacter sp. CRA2]OON67233.1 hypothetical protein B0919_19085 [Hymenobacter sp. CRA2]
MENNYAELAALKAENARLRAALAEQQAAGPAAAGLPGSHNPADLSQLLFLAEEVFAAVFLTDARGIITWVNRGFTQLCGFEAAQAVGQSAEAVFAQPPAGSAEPAPITSCWAQQLPWRFDVQNPCADGTADWLRVKLQPIFGPAGALLFYAGLIEDITEWKRAELELARNESRYRRLIENAPGVLFEWRENFDGTSHFVYASPKLQEIFGIDAPHANLITSYIHPDDRPRFVQSILDAKSQRSTWTFEGRLAVPGQPMRWFRSNSIFSGADELGLSFQGLLQDITASGLAAAAVRESEQRWRQAMEGIGNTTWEYEFGTGRMQLSPEYKRLFGYRDELVHLSENGYQYPNAYPGEAVAARDALAAYLRGETPHYSATIRLHGPDGQDHWVLSQGMITKRDAQGNPVLLTGSHTDVTDITRAQLALEVSSRRLASTIANLQRAVLLEDEHGKIILVNEAFCRMFRLPYQPEQLTGIDCKVLLEMARPHFSDEDGFVKGIARRQQQRQPRQGDLLALKDGRILEGESTPIYAQGQYAGYLWKYEDISKRKNDEEALKRREEKYRRILENLNLGLVETDRDGKVMFVNDSYCEITGYSQAELLHQSIELMLVNQQGQQQMREKRALHAQGISDTYELPIKTKRGDLKWLLVSGAPLYNEDKEHIGSIGVHLDISHQKQLEGKLRTAKRHAEESAQAKEMFLANMSHEMRTPMNAILGMSQLLAKTPLVAQQKNYLHAISTSAENLLVIINDILDLSKIEAGRMPIETIGFNLRKVCEQVEKTLRYKAEDKGLSLLIQVSPDIPEVLLGDPHRITQVLLNLAGNSVKFTEKGEIKVECELAGMLGHEIVVQFRVSDTGIGIDPQYLKSLFKDFSQEDSSVSRKFGGTGLGLSISRSLVNLMGGEIQIQSEKHRGTVSRFSLLLPIGTVTDLPRREVAVSSRMLVEALRGKRVLLVEDNEYNRMLAQSFLRHAQIEVTEADNGAVAVELARQQEFDLILMDVQMPIMDGYDATVQLRQELGLQIPIIALTANAIRGDDQKCLAVGMNDYLSKPFHEEELLKIVHEWLQPNAKSGEEVQLYRLDILQEAANNDHRFVAVMLRTFLKSSEDVLASMRAGLAASDMRVLKAAAHKIKPSLTHLHIYQVLEPVEQLDSWEGPFDQPAVASLVEITEKLLRQVMSRIALDLKADSA